MAFQPDIPITTPDGITLVVEAIVSLPNLECAEEDLKQYVVLIGLQNNLPARCIMFCQRGWPQINTDERRSRTKDLGLSRRRCSENYPRTTALPVGVVVVAAVASAACVEF